MSQILRKHIKSVKIIKQKDVINKIGTFIDKEKQKKSKIESEIFLRENIIKQIESIQGYLIENNNILSK